MRDVVTTTEARIVETGVASADEVRVWPRPLVQYSAPRRKLNAELRKFLYQNLYYNAKVREPNERGVRMLERLFQHYLDHPKDMGSQARKRARRVGRHRAICDYLAGMTDRYAQLEHDRLLG